MILDATHTARLQALRRTAAESRELQRECDIADEQLPISQAEEKRLRESLGSFSPSAIAAFDDEVRAVYEALSILQFKSQALVSAKRDWRQKLSSANGGIDRENRELLQALQHGIKSSFPAPTLSKDKVSTLQGVVSKTCAKALAACRITGTTPAERAESLLALYHEFITQPTAVS